ncbi:MAG: nucleotidyltransferase family protein [Planctomycetota bacterium]
MISAIVLAAGKSRRMGAPKLLLPVAGQPMIARIVDEVLRAAVDDIIVVIDRTESGVANALVGRRVRFVVNSRNESEMLDSLRCGLREVRDDCEAVLVVLGDQPDPCADVINSLIRGLREGNCGIVVPTFRGRRGHPLLFALRYRDEVMRRYDDVGLRGLLHAHPDDVGEVETTGPSVLEDIDRPEDYARRLRSGGNRP